MVSLVVAMVIAVAVGAAIALIVTAVEKRAAAAISRSHSWKPKMVLSWKAYHQFMEQRK